VSRRIDCENIRHGSNEPSNSTPNPFPVILAHLQSKNVIPRLYTNFDLNRFVYEVGAITAGWTVVARQKTMAHFNDFGLWELLFLC
jgi:hypothetical protein